MSIHCYSLVDAVSVVFLFWFLPLGGRCKPDVDNLTSTCLSTSCWDDVGFIDSLLDWLEQHVGIIAAL